MSDTAQTPFDLESLSFDAKAVAGAWFGIMRPGKGDVTFQLRQGKPSARAQAALDEMVSLGFLSVEAFNKWGGLVYRPLVDMSAAFDWLGKQIDNPSIKFPITELVENEADARAHQRAALGKAVPA